MKKLGLAFVCLLVLAGTVAAQTPVAAEGFVGHRGSAAGPLTTLPPASPSTGSIGTAPAAGGGFDVQWVIEFDMAAQPNAASATFQFYAGNFGPYPGTFLVYAMNGVNEDGVIGTEDHLDSGPAVSLVGSAFQPSSAFTASFNFNVKDALNFDVNNARPYSGYIIRYTGTLTRLGMSTHTDVPARLLFTPVPEPGTIALFGLGLLSIAGGYRIRRKKKV